MADIKDRVGEGGSANQVHDVALVQAMLKIVKDASDVSYFGSAYSGAYDGDTKDAIVRFQTDQKLLSDPGAPSKEKAGVLTPGGATIQKLDAMLPATHKPLWIMANTTTVYLEDTAANAQASKTAITNDAGLDAAFRRNVGTLVQKMYDQHKIALWLTPTGGHRTFAQQAKETKTQVGPGESYHQFGRAVDIGFKGFRWVRVDGTVKKDADWLNTLEAASHVKAMAFWDARDAIALKAPINLHHIRPFEIIHLQAFDNATVNAARSLAKLLTAVGTMKWTGMPGSPSRYKSDLGYGGPLFDVGTAKQIWAGNASVTKAIIAKAKAAKLKTKATPAVGTKDVLALKKTLKNEFVLADQNWRKWAPVP